MDAGPADQVWAGGQTPPGGRAAGLWEGTPRACSWCTLFGGTGHSSPCRRPVLCSKGSWEGVTPAEASALKRDGAERIITQDEAFMTHLQEVGRRRLGRAAAASCAMLHSVSWCSAAAQVPCNCAACRRQRSAPGAAARAPLPTRCCRVWRCHPVGCR